MVTMRCPHQRLSLYERIVLTIAGRGWIEAVNDGYPMEPCCCVPFVAALRRGNQPPLHRVLGSTVDLHRIHPIEWCTGRRYE